MSDEWQPTRWYRIMQPDGGLWMETSDPEEARDEAERTGRPLQRLWSRTESEWRPVT